MQGPDEATLSQMSQETPKNKTFQNCRVAKFYYFIFSNTDSLYGNYFFSCWKFLISLLLHDWLCKTWSLSSYLICFLCPTLLAINEYCIMDCVIPIYRRTTLLAENQTWIPFGYWNTITDSISIGRKISSFRTVSNWNKF